MSSLAPVLTLPDPAPGVIRIRLRSLDLLFESPAIDPFAGSCDGLSGIEHLKLALKRHWGSDTPDVTAVEWVVPAGQATDANRVATGDAMAAWCTAQAAVTRNALMVMVKERRRAWQIGGLFFAACFAVATGLEQIPGVSGFGVTLIAETIIIAGWVGIWHPLDLTLYAWWPHRFQLKLLARTSKLQVTLLPDPQG